MTPSTHHVGTSTDGERPLHVSGPGELLAAIPALLGYHPHRSLVVLALDGPTQLLGSIMRHDVVESADPAVATAVVDAFAARLARTGSTAVVAVVVDDAAQPRNTRYHDIITILSTRLVSMGVTMLGAYATTRITDGGRWWSLTEDGCTGTTCDPATSPITVAQIVAGRRIRSGRVELAELVAPDPTLRAEVGPLVAAAVAAFDLEWSAGLGCADQGLGHYQRTIEQLLRYVEDFAGGREPEAVEIAELGAILAGSRLIRDAVLPLALGSHAAAAEGLWTLATRALPDPYRAEAATLLAFGAQLRGDSALAGIAVAAALESNPAHRLAGLLDLAILRGVEREQLRTLVASTHRAAGAIGLELPPIDPDGNGPGIRRA